MKKCPLCLNNVENFHKKSHLLPEWMYKDIYNNNHKLIVVSLLNKHVKKKQKGIHDEIICSKCEIESQQFDHYASLILTDKSSHSIEYTLSLHK